MGGQMMSSESVFHRLCWKQQQIFAMKFILIASSILAVTTAIRVDHYDKNDSTATKRHEKRGLVNLAYGHHQEPQQSHVYGPPAEDQAPIYEVPAPAQHPPISQGYPDQILDQHHHHHHINHQHHHPGQFLTHPVAAAAPFPVAQPVAVPVAHPVAVAQPVPHPVPVPVPVYHTVTKHVAVPVDRPYPVPVAVPVPKPYPVHVEKIVHVDRPIAVPIEKHIHVPVDRPYAVPVPRPYPVPYEKYIHVDRPYPVHVAIPVHVPKPYPVPVAIHASHHFKAHHAHEW